MVNLPRKEVVRYNGISNIGTIHSFLNKFIIIPYSSLNSDSIGSEKLFIQCETDGIFERIKKEKKKNYSIKEAASLKKRIKESLNKKGYISFDQSLVIAKNCIESDLILGIISNRIQFLFIDEFQDTNNTIYSIIDSIRKKRQTDIYCVGDPEQFIQSFDISSKIFSNIPIIKVSISTKFDIELNKSNHRSSERIVAFLNNFNARPWREITFSQESRTGLVGENVKYISAHTNALDIITSFNGLCEGIGIGANDRCIISKKNDMVIRISNALNHNVKSPSKQNVGSPIKAVTDTLLSSLQLTQSEFCKTHNCDVLTLRKYSISILKAVQMGTITNENTYAKFITEDLQLRIKSGIPISIENIKAYLKKGSSDQTITVSNIHNIKGLEAEAVLAIAKTEAELVLWLETDRTERESYRDKEKTDYPRLGYVAFSRAKKFLCIGCMEPVNESVRNKLATLGVDIV